jgi:MFS family permease
MAAVTTTVPHGQPIGIDPTVAVSVAGVVALLGSLDTALNIAFPDLSDDLTLEVSAVQWIVISYVATYACLLVVAGRIADAIGHRTMLLWGLVVSTVGFTATSAAPGLGWLLAARVVQGVGVAIMLAAAPALVTLALPPERRGRGLGIFQMSAALGLAVGPIIGGFLVAWFGWRSVFWFRIPFSLLLLVVVLRVLPVAVSRGAGDRSAPLDLAPFRQAGFVLANALNVVSNAAMFGIWLLVPYYAVDVLDTGPVLGGVLLTVVPLVQAATSPIAGWASDRFGPGWITSAGLVVEALGLAALSRLDSLTAPPAAAAALAGVGLGLSMFGVPNMSYVMGSIDRAHQGVAAGLTQMMRTSGVVIGVFGASAYFEGRRLVHARQLAVDVDGIMSFVPAFQDTFLVASLVCGAGAVVSVLRAVTRSDVQPAPG